MAYVCERESFMENKYSIAAGGLKMIRTAKVLSILAVLLTVGATLAAGVLAGATVADNGALALGAAGVGGILLAVTGVLGVVGLVMELVGLGKTTGAHGGYKSAMLLVVVNIVVSVVATFLKGNGTLYNVLMAANYVITFLVVYLIISATVALLREKGDEATAAKGVTVRTIYLACTIINLATMLVDVFPGLAVIALGALIVSSLASLVALFKYIGFLGRSVNSFYE